MNKQSQVTPEHVAECVKRVMRVIDGYDSLVDIYMPGAEFVPDIAKAAQTSYREDLKLLAHLYAMEHFDKNDSPWKKEE